MRIDTLASLRGALRMAVLVIVGATLIATARPPEVRPISEAERLAVQIAAAYLGRGPAAVAEQLAANSPLRKLPPQSALSEIEVRLGPPAGATWELQTVVPALKDTTAAFSIEYPSGTDDTAIFDLVPEGGTYRINDIRMLALPSPKGQIFAAAAKPAAEPAKKEAIPVNFLLLGAGILASLVAGSAAFVFRASASGSRVMVTVAAVLIAAAVAFAFLRDDRFRFTRVQEEHAPVQESRYPSLASLLPLRRAATADLGDFDTAFAGVPKTGFAHDVGTLWKAQVDLQQFKNAEVKRALASFPSPADVPLVEILRARLALAEGDEVMPAIAYEHAVNLGPGRDALWLENAQALLALGYEDRAMKYLGRLTRIGSRNADVYYTLAVTSAWNDNEADAERWLKQAWMLRPAKRSELIQAATLWSVLRKESISTAISLSTPAEATFASPAATTRAVILPPDATSRISGDFLDVRVGNQRLLVPGGACLAPPSTPVVDPATWEATDEVQSLRELPQLLATNRLAATTQPVLRRRITRAATALSNHNRWQELLQLTDGLSPQSESVPADLLLLRSAALQRVDRTPEAKQLVAELALSRVLQRRRDTRALAHIAESLAAFDLYDAAVKVYDKSQSIRANPMIDDRVRQIQMNKRLATNYGTYSSPHFEIHYPSDVAPVAAVQMATVLEGEYKRLQAWVPTPGLKKVVVNVIWWQDFRSTYTGNDFILGFFQGKITLPFAGIPAYVPRAVAILSHELCHALIAHATHDQAPRWFHEGLAQRIEMQPYHANAFNMYDDNRLLAVSLLDAVMQASPDPGMISQAYIESQTVIRYIESAYGQAGIAKMLQAFRDGATTNDALVRLTGNDVAVFDAKLRSWGRSSARVFENPPPIRYDTQDDPLVRWSKSAAPGGGQ